MVRGVVPGDPDSAAKAFTDLKVELEKEKGYLRNITDSGQHTDSCSRRLKNFP
jgi:hypothetical protein